MRDRTRIVVRRRAAVGGEDLGERRRPRHDGGRAAGQRLQRGEPEGLVRAWCQRDIGRREDGRHRVAAADIPGEVDRQPGGLALQPRAHRSLPDHDESRVHARMAQRANGVDASVGMLLHRQPPAVHEEQLFAPRPTLPHLFRAVARVKLIEVDTQRHGQHVRCVNPVELRAGERGRAHHRVVVRGGPPVCEIRDAAGDATWKYLPDKAIQALMRDHHRGDAVSAAPTAERPQRQPVRHLDGVRRQVFQQGRHRFRQHRTVVAGERNQPGGQRDPGDAGAQLDPFGVAGRGR